MQASDQIHAPYKLDGATVNLALKDQNFSRWPRFHDSAGRLISTTYYSYCKLD